ncbi:SoxY-related AACIE arm protein [Siccirubricoccus sp. KC 17139]|uniref:SoxY-related AACIE arm protein n=1 Tax=Siccirubricoccus soli TaxID=2899147 RepID=A0ABT1CZH9_9PROT|nr:SoxY-related AACIE arm protein [Siccirubricoccus soli]MCO6415057.1 SoxY-related AACIE arm protein [Siccirubricoccus soli]MCP2681188.1 SoxY-related AACIE arm protein [Siccirubricoccus soli]
MMAPRRLLLAAPALLLLPRGSRASPEAMAEAVRGFTGGAEIRPGRVTLEISPLVENGNTVPLSVSVESPMTEAEHVRAIAVFNERNPQPHVITVHLNPRAGRAMLATHIRLATSQTLLAVAQFSDGSFWSDRAQVVVTLAACVEG